MNAPNKNDESSETVRFHQMLYELCTGLTDWPENVRAQQPANLPDMVFCAVSSLYSRNPWQWALDLKAAQRRGCLLEPIDQIKVADFFGHPLLMRVLDGLIVEASLPLMQLEPSFVPEEFDFGTVRLCKYDGDGPCCGRVARVTADALCGVHTGVVTVVEVCGQSVDGSPPNNTDPDTDLPFSPFQPRTVPLEGVWRQMWLLCEARREEFARHYAQYPKGGIKVVTTDFGSQIKSETPTAVVNEVLAKFLCYNIYVAMRSHRDLGISPLLWDKRTHLRLTDAE